MFEASNDCSRRTWSERRVIVSSKAIILAKANNGEDSNQDAQIVLLDAIPISQIDGICAPEDECCKEVGKGSNETSNGEKKSQSQNACESAMASPAASVARDFSDAGQKRNPPTGDEPIKLPLSGICGALRKLYQRGSELPDVTDDFDPHPAGGGGAAPEGAVEIRTRVDGHNAGRIYRVRAGAADIEALAQLLSGLARAARAQLEARTLLQRAQERCRAVYLSTPVQGFIALLIITVR